jgi:hypothetical protein
MLLDKTSLDKTLLDKTSLDKTLLDKTLLDETSLDKRTPYLKNTAVAKHFCAILSTVQVKYNFEKKWILAPYILGDFLTNSSGHSGGMSDGA